MPLPMPSTHSLPLFSFPSFPYSFQTDLFYGQLKSTVTCDVCGHVSTVFEPFSDLSVAIPRGAKKGGGGAGAAGAATAGGRMGGSTGGMGSRFGGSRSYAAAPAQSAAPSSCSLVDCLKEFTSSEHLTGASLLLRYYYCSVPRRRPMRCSEIRTGPQQYGQQ